MGIISCWTVFSQALSLSKIAGWPQIPPTISGQNFQGLKSAHEDMIDHCSYTHNSSSCKIKAWKNSGLNGTQTHHLCDIGDTGAVFYQ